MSKERDGAIEVMRQAVNEAKYKANVAAKNLEICQAVVEALEDKLWAIEALKDNSK